MLSVELDSIPPHQPERWKKNLLSESFIYRDLKETAGEVQEKKKRETDRKGE